MTFSKGDPLVYIGFGEGDQYEKLDPGGLYACGDVLKDGKIKLWPIAWESWLDKDAVFDSKHFSPYDKRTSLEDIQRFCHMGEPDGDFTIWDLEDRKEFEGLNVQKLYLRLRRLNHLRTPDRLVDVPFDEIQWPGFDLPKRMRGRYCVCCDGARWADADLDAPGILIEGVKTFSGRKYYNVDGRHRIEKLIDLGKTSASHWVFHIDELIPYIQYDENHKILRGFYEIREFGWEDFSS